ncbi:hypothetical protein Tco_1069830 [Tanacetum coccineum]|uniref:Uncharacterized protein n=1 Tax=Tanacetum coccineum TaxID=301880 RepID=A0ABQ5HJN7_9ASTR
MSSLQSSQQQLLSSFPHKFKPSGPFVESSKQKPLKKFTYINEKGETFQMAEEEIENQKGIEQIVKAAKSEIKKGKQDLIDLLGLDVVEKMYKDKVKYDIYCLKILNRWDKGKITNCDVLLRGKCPIILKLELDFNKPLDEQAPIINLNLLARNKRKNVDDLHDYFKSTKSYMRSVQFDDHQVGTVLNEPSLGMILFNSSQRKDFVNIEDFEELNNEMLYNVQEIFFRLHQGPGQNDLARTFSSPLVDEVKKRNLNPNKQMRLIEQLSPSEAASGLQFVLWALERSSSIFNSVYVADKKETEEGLKKSFQLGCQCQAERCRFSLRS